MFSRQAYARDTVCLDSEATRACMGEVQANKTEMKHPSFRKVGRPSIGEVAMTPNERSRRYRQQYADSRRHTSFDIAATAHLDLQRIADQAGVSATGVLLVAIHLLTRMDSAEVAKLAPSVAEFYGQRVELTDVDGKVSRVQVGGYGSS